MSASAILKKPQTIVSSCSATKDAGGLILLKTFDDYYNGYDDADGTHHTGWAELIKELLEKFPLSGDPRGLHIVGEKTEKEFIKLLALDTTRPEYITNIR